MKPYLARKIVGENYVLALARNTAERGVEGSRGSYALPIERDNPLFGFSQRFNYSAARKKLKGHGYNGLAGTIDNDYRGHNLLRRR